MEINDYQKNAMKYNDRLANQRLIKRVGEMAVMEEEKIEIGDLFQSLIGLSEEMGEISKNINQWVFRETRLNVDTLADNIGDLIWYVAELCNALGWDLEEILMMNLDKLKSGGKK